MWPVKILIRRMHRLIWAFSDANVKMLCACIRVCVRACVCMCVYVCVYTVIVLDV